MFTQKHPSWVFLLLIFQEFAKTSLFLAYAQSKTSLFLAYARNKNTLSCKPQLKLPEQELKRKQNPAEKFPKKRLPPQS